MLFYNIYTIKVLAFVGGSQKMIDVNALQKYSLFGGVSPEQIEKIKPLLETGHFEAGECPQVEGQPNDKIYFILSGEVDVIKQGVVIARLREGETFGEMELLDIMPSIATVRAATALDVVMISNRALYDISKLDLKTFSMMIMNLARDLSRRLRRMDELVCEETKGS